MSWPFYPMSLNRKPRILVVDDDISVVHLMRETLQMEGYEVLTAMDGLTAREIAWAQTPDLIISDISMPGMDGLAAIESIYERPSMKRTPIIFVSGKVHERMERKGEMRMAVLPKPFRIDELSDLTRRFLTPALA